MEEWKWEERDLLLCPCDSFYFSHSSGEPCTTQVATSPSCLHLGLWSMCLGVLSFTAIDSVNCGCYLEHVMELALNTKSITRASLLRWWSLTSDP